MDSNVTNLEVDDSSLVGLCDFGLAKMCPRVQKAAIRCNAKITFPDIIESLQFPKLVDLRLERSTTVEIIFGDATSICNMMANVWNELGQLTICRIEMTDTDMEKIMQSADGHKLKPTVTFS